MPVLGMVRQWQEKFYEKRYSHSLMPEQPDFVKLSEAYGIKGFRCANAEEARKTLEEAFNYPGPALIDCRVIQDEIVCPMVPTGKGLHEMIGVGE